MCLTLSRVSIVNALLPSPTNPSGGPFTMAIASSRYFSASLMAFQMLIVI